jgi:Protein of unknown function (DUF3159)
VTAGGPPHDGSGPGAVPADAVAPEPTTAAGPAGQQAPPVVFDRHLVLQQLGGWRGMLDATLPTLAFIVANAIGGLRPGIWAAVAAAVLVFVLRLARRQSVQQAVSGLFAVAIAVAIAAWLGQARGYFAFGIARNAVVGGVLLLSVLLRRPLVGYIAEFLAPSHLGVMAAHSAPGLRDRMSQMSAALHPAQRREIDPGTGLPAPDPTAERHWRDDRRMLRAYSWLTLVWAAMFLLRVLIQGPLYQLNEVGLLGVLSIALGLPLTGVCLLVTVIVVSRLHRHRSTAPAEGTAAPAADRHRPDA